MGDNLNKILFLTLAFALLLSSCTVSGMSAPDVMTKLDSGQGYVFVNGADISSVNYISPEKMGYLYYGEKTAVKELDYTESYCIHISKSISASEIHIFKAKYQSDVDKLKRMLQSRADILSKPQINPNDSDFLTDVAITSRVISKGRFVFLVAGEDSDAVLEKIEGIF